MSKRLRILHTADSHIGAELPVRPRRPGRRRGDDLVDAFGRILRQAIQREIDLVIHAGDLFNRSEPSSRALAAAAEPLLRVAVAGIPVVIVPGNHERSTIPTCLLLSHPNIHIVTAPCTLTFQVRGTRVGIAAFPCIRRDSAKRFPAALEATEWARLRTDVTILAVHQTFESATCGPNNHRFRRGDDVIDRKAVPQAFDYVAAGHVHRHQTLSLPTADGPQIVYAGSPDRVSFAESDEPKGCVMLEEAEGRLVHTFLEHAVRPMSAWPMDITGWTRSEILRQIEAIVGKLPMRGIAQVRLTGCTSPDILRGLKLTTVGRELRPDVLFSVSARAVEFGPQSRPRRSNGATLSAFTHLQAPPEAVTRVAVEDLKRVPTGCGVYALHDRAGRLLYIGKSKNMRNRIRSHVRGGTGANFFVGWGRQIAHVEIRLAESELEALLVEAELIRGLRPPYNRQMRKWTAYCYLFESGRPHGHLEVCRQPSPRRISFGPYRSRSMAHSVRDAVAAHFGLALCPDGQEVGSHPKHRTEDVGRQCKRYFQGMCTGPCAGRVDRQDYANRIHLRNALLLGKDDTTLRQLELELETGSDRVRRAKSPEDPSLQVRVLRIAFDQAAILRKAETLTSGLLVLPGPEGTVKTASLTARGIRFDALRSDPTDAKRVLTQHERITGDRRTGAVGRLSRTTADSFCVAARQLGSIPGLYRFVSKQETMKLDELSLLAIAFRDAGRRQRVG